MLAASLRVGLCDEWIRALSYKFFWPLECKGMHHVTSVIYYSEISSLHD